MSERPSYIQHRLLIQDIQNLIFEINEKGYVHGHYSFGGHCPVFTVSLSRAAFNWMEPIRGAASPWLLMETISLDQADSREHLAFIGNMLTEFLVTMEKGHLLPGEFTFEKFEQVRHAHA